MRIRPRCRLDIVIEKWPLKEPFRITGHVLVELNLVVVSLHDGELTGRGEAAGVYYKGDSPQRIAAQIEAVRSAIEQGASRDELRTLLPAGGARNAVDCALWDLESKRSGLPVWQLAGVRRPVPLLTTYTLGANDPQKMADAARSYADARALKLKLTGEPTDADRVTAVRAARPDVWLGVDANQGFCRESLQRLLPVLADARVQLIEQPFAIGQDADLDGLKLPIPIAADESVQDLSDLPGLVGRFDVVNIKLDKCGGLTEGLLMAAEARRLGLKVMVGNMGGTSLSTAPGFVIGQLCDIVDLDGQLLLMEQREPAAIYDDAGCVACPDQVWGFPAARQLHAASATL